MEKQKVPPKWFMEYDYGIDWPKTPLGFLMHPTNYVKELEWEHKQKERKEHQEFVKEFTKENSEWVKQRRLEYLYNELSENIHWLPDKTITEYCDEILMWHAQKRVRQPKYNENDINDAREAEIANFVEIKRYSGGYGWGICPFHDDTRPSLCVYPHGRGWYCFACNEGGNTIDLVMKLFNISFIEALDLILKR